jgi:hypothetical protein
VEETAMITDESKHTTSSVFSYKNPQIGLNCAGFKD